VKGVIDMMVNTDNLVSITEANRNFSQVARMVDKNGSVVILKNNVPRYLLVEFNQAEAVQEAPDEDLLKISQKLIAKNREAYEELAR
jgi:antitoxin Phd